MSSCLRRYFACYELNTLDACWIAVDVWSNSSRCRKYRSTCLGRDAYMYDHCLRYRHDFARLYQLLDSNLFTHRDFFYFERSLLWTLWPRGLLHIIFSALHFYFVALSAFRSHFAINLEGIDNPFIALGASSFVFAQVLCCITLSSSRGKPMQAQSPSTCQFLALLFEK